MNAGPRIPCWPSLLTLLTLVAGCSGSTPARDQWLVEVSSDAPTPLVGDRLLIEALDQDGTPLCDSCRRQFGVSSNDTWPVSFGIAADGTSGDPLVRVRLYRVANTGDDGLPLSPTTLDRTVRLPTANGITRVGIELDMACLSEPSDLDAHQTCDPKSGTLAAVPRGTEPRDTAPKRWDPGLEEACSSAAPEDAVCVPSGAFMQGDAHQIAVFEQALSVPERLVVVSSFFLDENEFSVGQLRALRRDVPGLAEPTRYDASTARYCTYLGPDDDQNDAMAVNCLSQALAAEICAARDMRLPTEAEWEFAAGNREEQTRFPWGNDEEDPCDAAIHGLSSILGGNSHCRFERPPDDQQAGPRAGTTDRDVTELGIYNLAGGMAEWTSDSLVPYDDPCWGEGAWLTDPTCVRPGAPHVVRGSSWEGSLQEGAAANRDGAPGGGTETIGLRCAKDGNP